MIGGTAFKGAAVFGVAPPEGEEEVEGEVEEGEVEEGEVLRCPSSKHGYTCERVSGHEGRHVELTEKFVVHWADGQRGVILTTNKQR